MFGALLEVEMSKKCTPLWREAHVEVKMWKTPHVRTTFGSWDVEKVHAVVEHQGFGPLLDVQMSFRVAGARDCGLGQKWAKTAKKGFVAFPKRIAGVGHLKRLCKDAFSVYKRHLHQSCLEVRALISWEGLHFGASDLQVCWDDFNSTSYDLASLFRGRRNTLDRWTGKMAKRIGTRPSALHSTFHFWRKSRRILSFLMLSTLKMKKSRRIALFLTLSSSNIEDVSQNCCVFDVVNFSEEVSQNCFVFDVVKFKHWGSLADLLRFWCCQLWKMKKSRRIARFWSLQIDG